MLRNSVVGDHNVTTHVSRDDHEAEKPSLPTSRRGIARCPFQATSSTRTGTLTIKGCSPSWRLWKKREPQASTRRRRHCPDTNAGASTFLWVSPDLGFRTVAQTLSRDLLAGSSAGPRAFFSTDPKTYYLKKQKNASGCSPHRPKSSTPKCTRRTEQRPFAYGCDTKYTSGATGLPGCSLFFYGCST